MERPPGITGAALVVALAMAAILAAFGVVLTQLVENSASASDSAALILLAPGLVAASLLPGTFESAVRKGPVRARVVLLITSFVAVAAATALIAVDTAVAEGGKRPLLRMWSIWGPLTILQVAAAWSAWQTYRYIRKSFGEACEWHDNATRRVAEPPFAVFDRYEDGDQRRIDEIIAGRTKS